MVLCLGKSDEEPEDEYDALPFSLRWRMHFGKRQKDPHSGQDVMRLSANKLLQTHCISTEYQALKLVDRHTSVPTYKVLGVYNRPDGKMVEYEAIPGKPLTEMWGGMSADKKNRMIADLGRYVEQLRKMEPPKHYVIGDATLGGALDDHRFGRGRIGPFYTIEDFHDFVRRGHPLKDFSDEDVQACHGPRPKPYDLKFTHAQLTPKNILVDDAGRVSAIIGWESAGWYPEYWEYTRMNQETTPEFEDWLSAMNRVVPKYEVELRAEDVLKRRYNSSMYDRPRSVRPPSPTPSELRQEAQEIDDKNTESTSG